MVGIKEHFVSKLEHGETGSVSIKPVNGSLNAKNGDKEGLNIQYDDSNVTGMCLPVPEQPNPTNGRAPVYYEPEGYVRVKLGQHDVDSIRYEESGGPTHVPAPQYLSDDQFNKFAQNFKRENGQYVAMTCYGAVPLPEEVVSNIPEKFEQEPIIKEHKQFVFKNKAHDRVVSQQYVQHKHHFIEVPKSGVVNKVVTNGKEKVISIPKYTYKGVITDNIIEMPQGFRYMETPLDVHLPHPPKLVPVSEKLYVQRTIKCTKPVIKERIVEVPKIIRKEVDHFVTKNVPYIVPKYVEKVIEVPFEPGMKLPAPTGKVYTDIPDIEATKKYVDYLNEKTEHGLDHSLIIGPGGIQYRLAPDGKHVLNVDGTAAVDRVTGTPVVIGESATPAFTGTDCMSPYMCDGDVFVNNCEEETVLYLPPGAKRVHLATEAEIILESVDAETARRTPIPESTLVNDFAGPMPHYTPAFLTPGADVQPAMGHTREVRGGKGLIIPDYTTTNIGPEVIDHPDAIYAVSMDPVIQHDGPGLRDIRFETSSRQHILTSYGEQDAECVNFVTCGNPASCVTGPIDQSSTSVPLTAAGRPDTEAMEIVEAEYMKRTNNRVFETMNHTRS